MRVPGFQREFRFPWRSGEEVDRDVDEELSFHLDMRAEELEAAGLEPGEARRRAFEEFGDAAGTRRELAGAARRHETRRSRLLALDELHRDIRFAIRGFRRSRSFAATAILVLALAIGANSSIFSILNLMLFKPLVVEEPDRLVRLYGKNTSSPDVFRAFSYPNYQDFRDRAHLLTDVTADVWALVALEAEGDAARREIARLVSRNYFDVLGVSMARGRVFSVEESAPDASIQVAIISNELWTELGAEQDLGDVPLRINGSDYRVVGVAPPRFTGTSRLLSPDVWLPLGVYGDGVAGSTGTERLDLVDRNLHVLTLVGRLAPGVGVKEAERELKGIAAQLSRDFPDINRDHTVVAGPLPRLSMASQPAQDAMFVAASATLMGMASVVLLIACLNLANMLLARGAARAKEIALRQSLGGGRARILRQLLTEAMVLSGFGGLVGVVLAYWSNQLIVASVTPVLPVGGVNLEIEVDARVLAATLGFCVAATALFGIGPALRLVRADVVADLKDGGRLGSGGARLVPGNALVVAQIALSLVLLTAAGLFTRGALRASNYEPSYEVEGAVLAELDTALAGYDEARTREFLARLLERVRAIPAVESATISSNVPLSYVVDEVVLEGPGSRRGGQGDGESALFGASRYVVGSDYFAAMGLPLLRGRDFTEAEAMRGGSASVAIVSEPLAHELSPDVEILGRQLLVRRSRNDGEPTRVRVVGVVPGVRQFIVPPMPPRLIYLPFGANYRPQMILHARLRGRSPAAESAMLQTLQTEIRAIDDRLPILSLRSLEDQRRGSAELWLLRTGAKVLAALGAIALLLALTGVYGVKSYVVSRRTREIGIRMALGARPSDVLVQLLLQGLVVAVVGLGIGLVLSLLMVRLLASALWEVSPTDPVSFVGASILLTVAALLATYLPSRRATRVTPTSALRHE